MNNEKYCSYCKGSIEENEDFAVIDGNCYHISCAKQMHCYWDSLDWDNNEKT